MVPNQEENKHEQILIHHDLLTAIKSTSIGQGNQPTSILSNPLARILDVFNFLEESQKHKLAPTNLQGTD
ncbi:hypothetical protein PGT21_012707 [Puccinia graminis f. sp. tritici]|uniref:Uncharacterized protein n=1 Tax=Puccinia graminis f. sp. tritici TaxID=56615 RepID=A0A5B0P7V5_PUCGR|nr:hypothetical protein PGT21_012707 [Puccinia graminis f. sp. tritici]